MSKQNEQLAAGRAWLLWQERHGEGILLYRRLIESWAIGLAGGSAQAAAALLAQSGLDHAGYQRLGRE